jgi:hypothetical protein
MKPYYHDKQIKNEGSAWHFLFKIGAAFILFCALPLLAFKSPLFDKIDKWSNSVDGNLTILISVLFVLMIIVYVCGRNWWKNNAW